MKWIGFLFIEFFVAQSPKCLEFYMGHNLEGLDYYSYSQIQMSINLKYLKMFGSINIHTLSIKIYLIPLKSFI